MAIAEGSTVGQGNSTVTPLPGAELQQESERGRAAACYSKSGYLMARRAKRGGWLLLLSRAANMGPVVMVDEFVHARLRSHKMRV